MKQAVSSIMRHVLRASLMTPALLLSSLCAFEAHAISIALNGTRTVLSGSDCGIASYRFGTTASYGGKTLDLIVQVLEEDNEYSAGQCIGITNGVLSIRVNDEDAGDDVGFMTVKITVVEQGTTTPVEVDRLLVTGFDLDIAGSGTGTDDVYLKSPDSSYLSSSSQVQYSKGSFFGGQFQAKLKGTTSGNCDDGTTVVDETCRGGSVFVTGANGINTVSSFTARLQNDNAYGQTNTATSHRLFQLSLEINDFNPIVDNNVDRGDAPSSYGNASHSINANVGLGYGLIADNDATAKSSATADGDDTDPQPIEFDDEDAVSLNGSVLDGQVISSGTVTNFDVSTFGSGFLSAWADLDGDGSFSGAGEQILTDFSITTPTVALSNSTIPISIPPATASSSYIRFRFTETTGITATGASSAEGEVEDYAVTLLPVASNPDVLLVKRITAINGQVVNPNDGTDLAGVMNDGVANSSDDADNWPNNYLVGALNAGSVQPGDDIEYTVYFLNAGGVAAEDVRLCDRLFPNQSLVTDAYGTGIDVELQLGTSAVLGLTVANDASDRTEFVAPSAPVSATCNLKDLNDDGTLVIEVTGASGTGNPTLTALPGSTGSGTPNDAYGLFRFKTRVAP